MIWHGLCPGILCVGLLRCLHPPLGEMCRAETGSEQSWGCVAATDTMAEVSRGPAPGFQLWVHAEDHFPVLGTTGVSASMLGLEGGLRRTYLIAPTWEVSLCSHTSLSDHFLEQGEYIPALWPGQMSWTRGLIHAFLE